MVEASNLPKAMNSGVEDSPDGPDKLKNRALFKVSAVTQAGTRRRQSQIPV